ncbi:MAG: hypothetical protein HF978_17080 [Desulfobacteraceae bacterium]|nr:hypothetical protein [Desulfobacteraceae bacterium]MBC2757259.1 hypothetical protein [Desulfobacteraceae bacterium]
MEKQRAETQPVFKKCPNCGFEWNDRESFLKDPDVEIVGYQVNFIRLSAGYFLFNHSCKGTFSVQAVEFKDLYHGPIFTKRATGQKECPEYCLHQDELRPCPAQCECAYVREILQTIKNRPKRRDSESFSSVHDSTKSQKIS